MLDMITWISEFGIGIVAVAIIFVGFGYFQFQELKDTKKAHANQTQVLKDVASTNKQVTEALSIITNVIKDKFNMLEAKSDRNYRTSASYRTEFSRVESKINSISESVVKIEDRQRLGHSKRTTQCDD